MHDRFRDSALLGCRHGTAVGGHVAGMLLQIAGETMVAFIVAHEIEEIGVRGVHGSLQ